MEISVVFVTAQISAKSKQLAPSPLKNPFLPTTTHMTCGKSSLLGWKCSRIKGGLSGGMEERLRVHGGPLLKKS